ncbi:MAG: gliding motility protein GldL [Bacteroidales bacterium]
MGKYKGFKNRLEKYFSSEEGQRLLNFAYSFGAAIVILGALFKLIHFPMADLMLCVGMGTEALIFALSAFDKPATSYRWEEVFPVLKSEDPADRPDLSAVVQKMQSSPNYVAAAPAPSADSPVNTFPDVAVDTSEAAFATQRYVQEISKITAQLDNLSTHSTNYIQQMEALNRNITGLNTIYEIQLKSVSSQLDTIDKVNNGLANIRNLYDNSTMDSFKIRQETEKMTDNLAQLNKIYERMLTAMTVNMQNPASGR